MAESDFDRHAFRDAIRQAVSVDFDPRLATFGSHSDRSRREKFRQRARELGWNGIQAPEEFAGLGLGFEALAILYTECGRVLAPAFLQSTNLAIDALGFASGAAQIGELRKDLVSGLRTGTLALREWSGTLSSTQSKDGTFILHGRLDAVPEANEADVLLLPVALQHETYALAIVDRAASGVQIQALPAIDETRYLCAIDMNEATVSKECLFVLKRHELDWLADHAAFAIACDSVGAAGAILELTVEYLKTRVQFDRVIGSFQALKHRAAAWKIQIEAVSSYLDSAASHLSRHVSTSAASSAKFLAADMFAAVAGDAIQLHGGIGFTREHVCHRYFKRAKLNQCLFGESAFHKDRAADLVFLAED